MKQVSYELVDGGTIARIALDRPDKRNAQSRRMLYELDDAFTTAARDDSVKVIVLAGNGPHFSAGHDLRDSEEYVPEPLFTEGSWSRPGAEGAMAQENEMFFSLCRRWHDIPKPTIDTFSDPTVSHRVNRSSGDIGADISNTTGSIGEPANVPKE